MDIFAKDPICVVFPRAVHRNRIRRQCLDGRHMDHTGDTAVQFTLEPRQMLDLSQNEQNNILACMAIYTSMPPCNIRDIHCKMKGQISKT